MCDTKCLHATPFCSPLKRGTGAAVVGKCAIEFVGAIHESPVQAEAKRKNGGNAANAIENGMVRTPEDGRPYGIISECIGHRWYHGTM